MIADILIGIVGLGIIALANSNTNTGKTVKKGMDSLQSDLEKKTDEARKNASKELKKYSKEELEKIKSNNNLNKNQRKMIDDEIKKR